METGFSIAAILLVLCTHGVSSCRISEFFCDNGECFGLDKFCDGKQDCSDGSDETRSCSRCNRTYYGDRYKTYVLDLSDPAPEKLPFVCVLTFMAGGGELGDIVELTFSSFRVGRLRSGAPQSSASKLPDVSCVGGYLQVVERAATTEAAAVAGHFCGTSDTLPVFYSETNNVSLILTILPRTSESVKGDVTEATGDANPGSGFEFTVKFRFVSRSDAVTRYGPPQAPYHRGEWIPGTVCDRSFQDCDSQPCKLQSPNFPGFYLRNVTCLYHITQRTIPRRQHALISLRQPLEEKVSIRASGPREAPPFAFVVHHERRLLFGESCLLHDYIRIYDGSDTMAPVLATFCREGALPSIVASGPEIVVEFRSSPADSLSLHAFEVDVDVTFVSEGDVGLRAFGQRCEWTVNGTGDQRSGMVHSLRHVASPGTTCNLKFRGRRHDIVWLYFVRYSVERGVPLEDATPVPPPSARGEILDGENASVVLETYSADRTVRLCVHARGFLGFVPLRPCKFPDESYLSSGPLLTLRYAFSESVNLQYIRFEARYEFVDTYLEGEGANPGSSSEPCQRVLRSSVQMKGSFASPHNTFLFGRGGESSLRCSFKFVGREGETLRLVVRKLRLGNRKCESTFDTHARRYSCRRNNTDQKAELSVSQVLWGRYEVPLACLCRLDRSVTIDIVSNVAYVNFTVDGMTSLDDFTGFHFEASYEFLASQPPGCSLDRLIQRSSGEVNLHVTVNDFRDGLAVPAKCPWLLATGFERPVFLRIVGSASLEVCDTRNRVVVFAPEDLEPLTTVCPNPGTVSVSSSGAVSGSAVAAPPGQREVEVFPKSWNRSITFGGRHRSTNLLVEFVAVEPGKFVFKWARADRPNSNTLLGRKLRSEGECNSGCKGVEACGSHGHGPNTEGVSGQGDPCEEQEPRCPPGSGDWFGGGGDSSCFIVHFPWLYVGIGIGCGILVTTILVASLVHRRRETKAKKGKPVPTDEFPMDGKEVEC